MNLVIRDFQPGDEAAFKAINEVWIRRHFAMEPKDEETLDHPKQQILDKGGRIFLGLVDDEPAGCCALLAMTHAGEFEVAKMAVADAYKGAGIGRKLLAHTIREAWASGATRLYLETNQVLTPAIRLYESSGFRHVPPKPSVYSRANVFMELLRPDSA